MPKKAQRGTRHLGPEQLQDANRVMLLLIYTTLLLLFWWEKALEIAVCPDGKFRHSWRRVTQMCHKSRFGTGCSAKNYTNLAQIELTDPTTSVFIANTLTYSKESPVCR